MAKTTIKRKTKLRAAQKSLEKVKAKYKIPTVAQCVKAVGLPPEAWKGRCHEVAAMIGQQLLPMSTGPLI